MNTEDKKIFSLLDQMDVDEFYNILEDTEESKYPPIPEQSLSNIKEKTYKKLVINPARKKNRLQLWGSLAASLFFVWFVTSSIGSTVVWAKLQSALQYIPGMNIVIEDKEKEEERYVLTKPIEKQVGGGTIRIEGVVVDKNNAQIDISARNLPPYDYKEIFFKNARGEQFYISSHATGMGTGEWRGSFVHHGFIKDINGLQIVISEKDNVSISIPLEQAKKFAAYSEIGPTATVQGISITAIADKENGKTRINLISPPMHGTRIDSYGINLLSGKPEIALRDNEGKRYNLSHDDSHMGTLSEFYFETGQKPTKDMILSIPHVSLCIDDQKTVRIWIPRKGSAVINKFFELGEFPVIFKNIHRLEGNKVKIDVNLAFKPNATEALYDFRLDERGYTAVYDEKTGAIKTLEFEISPNQLWVTLKVKDPLVFKKGPWEIKLEK